MAKATKKAISLNISQVCAQVQFASLGKPGCDATVLRDSSGFLWGGYLWNSSTEDRYVKLYELGRTPMETDAPVQTYYLPPKSFVPLPPMVFGQNGPYNAGGVGFDNGIGLRITCGPAWDDVVPAAPWEVQGALWMGGI